MLQLIAAHPLMQAVLDTFNGFLLVLDCERRIVAINKAALDRFVGSSKMAVGLRPGELLRCINTREGERETPCGGTAACASCPMSPVGERSSGPERFIFNLMTKRAGVAQVFEFDVLATPLEIEAQSLTVLSFRDITDQRRRTILERVFFHDILNTVSGIKAWRDLIDVPDQDLGEISGRLHHLVQRLTAEIRGQQVLLQAERAELEPFFATYDTGQILDELNTFFVGHPVAKSKLITIGSSDGAGKLRTDIVLTLRVLTNMVKNALEASGPGDIVKVRCGGAAASVKITVWNAGAIPREVAVHLFKRIVSTKGDGRGWGTYSMKLLGEQYLGGAVSFTSSDEEGTTFSLELPRFGDIRSPWNNPAPPTS